MLGANTNHSWSAAPHNQEKPSCKLFQKMGSSVNVNDLVTSEWGHKRTSIQYFSGKSFPEKYRYSGGEIDNIGNRKLLTGDTTTDARSPTQAGLRNTKWSLSRPYHGSYGARPNRLRATTIAWGNGNLQTAPFNDHTKRKEIYLAGVDREFCPVDFVKHYGTHRHTGSTATAGTWHGQSSQRLNMVAEGDALYTGSKSNILDAHGCSINTAVGSQLDDCYRNLNCNWSWIGPASPKGEGYQGDKGSSGIYMTPINSSDKNRKRKVCHKKSFNKNSSSNANHMSNGGASVSPTRMIVDGKLKFGVMPDKAPTKAGADYWKNMVITSIGDSSQPE